MSAQVAGWVVQPMTGQASRKAYRCPGCNQMIPAGVPHRVVWPDEPGGVEDRRHWHTPCSKRAHAHTTREDHP